MISGNRTKNAFEADQDLLFVPVPADETRFYEGFVSQVMQRFPVAQVRLRQAGGVQAGEVLIMDNYWRMHEPRPKYNLAFAGTHLRQQHGWDNAPEFTRQSLDHLATMTLERSRVTLAVAGRSGTGYSGLQGNADFDAIEGVLRAHQLSIYVYDRASSGVRAELAQVNPQLDADVALTSA